MSPIIDELAIELEGKVKVCKVDVDVENDLARQFEVMSIPTLILFENGIPKKKTMGFKSKVQLLDFIK